VTAGVASLAVRDLVRGTRRHGRVLAALPHAIYLEFADAVPEPRVLAVSPPDVLHCAARGQAAAEVSAVLLGMAGQEPLEPAASRLLTAGQGVDLAWGLVAGCRAALLLSVS